MSKNFDSPIEIGFCGSSPDADPSVNEIGKIIGTWPGDETDAELLKGLEEVRHPVVANPSPESEICATGLCGEMPCTDKNCTCQCHKRAANPSPITPDEEYLKKAKEFMRNAAKLDNAPTPYMIAAAFKNEDRAKAAEAREATLHHKLRDLLANAPDENHVGRSSYRALLANIAALIPEGQ